MLASRRLLQNAPIACHEIDVQGIVRFVNRAECLLLGLHESDILGRHVWDFVVAEDRERSRTTILRKLAGEQPLQPFERRFQHPAGARLILEVHEAPVLDASGALSGIRGFLLDITRRRRAEELLQESERRYRHIVEHASDLIYRTDLTGRFVFFNRTGARILGFEPEELLGQRYHELPREDFRRRAQVFYRDQLVGRVPNTYFELPLIGKDGREFWFGQKVMLIEEDGRPRGFEGVARDITVQHRAVEELARTRLELELRVIDRTTELELINQRLLREIEERQQAEEERRHLEAQVQHSQRLESLGVLAGGIAHDFNNLLATMMGFASLALLDIGDNAAARASLEEVVRGAHAAADLTKQMLAYSGHGKLVVEPIDLSRLVDDLLRLIVSLISKKASLQLHLSAELPAVTADAGQMRQVILNLVTNASDSLGEGNGEIHVRTTAVRLRPAQVKTIDHGATLPPGHYVLLEVRDTGCGMDEATLARIFDPFFSTKFTGRGLGLAALLGIVRGHGGSVVVSSRPGDGACFQVYLPATADPVPPPAPQPAPPEWRGDGLALVVDDEAAVRDLAARILHRAGFAVVTAHDGHAALDRFHEHGARLRIVILDWTMPGMDGGEVYRAMKRHDPDVRVIICSGYNPQELNAHCADTELPAILTKPYLPEQLLALVRDALSA